MGESHDPKAPIPDGEVKILVTMFRRERELEAAQREEEE